MNNLVSHRTDSGPQPLLNPAAASHFLGVSKSFLDKKRVRGDGPPFCKIGRRVAYRLIDLEQWIGQRRFNSTSEAQQ